MSAAVESSELATRIVERSTDIDDMTVFRDEIMSMDQFPTLSELLGEISIKIFIKQLKLFFSSSC